MSKRKLFGTDGIRGTANTYPMTAELAQKVAIAAGSYLREKNRHTAGHRPKAIIGKDTRLSGYLLEPALTSGFISAGMDVVTVGPLPTPAISKLVSSMRADLGVMISASHNPHHDNGIKLFDAAGYKLSDQAEYEIEQRISGDLGQYLVDAEKLGRAMRLEDARGRYTEFVKSTFPKDLTLEGLKVVVDCANGAAYKVAPEVLYELGADVIAIGVEPNGLNINEICGATYPDAVSKAVLEHEADIGIALDGDADRVIVVDETGCVVDGDQIIALIAAHWQKKGLLSKPELVGTLMSNLGMEKFLQQNGVTLHRAKVGDRYVMEMMMEKDINIGGEQSGHVILKDYATTGDGLMAALQVLAVVCESKKRTSEVCQVFAPSPQILRNIRFTGEDPCDSTAVMSRIEEAEQILGENGRIVIRKSGTEPVIRVMAQGFDATLIEKVVNDISEEIEKVANG